LVAGATADVDAAAAALVASTTAAMAGGPGAIHDQTPALCVRADGWVFTRSSVSTFRRRLRACSRALIDAGAIQATGFRHVGETPAKGAT